MEQWLATPTSALARTQEWYHACRKAEYLRVRVRTETQEHTRTRLHNRTQTNVYTSPQTHMHICTQTNAHLQERQTEGRHQPSRGTPAIVDIREGGAIAFRAIGAVSECVCVCVCVCV